VINEINETSIIEQHVSNVSIYQVMKPMKLLLKEGAMVHLSNSCLTRGYSAEGLFFNGRLLHSTVSALLIQLEVVAPWAVAESGEWRGPSSVGGRGVGRRGVLAAIFVERGGDDSAVFSFHPSIHPSWGGGGGCGGCCLGCCQLPVRIA